jgi:hypothetical protein
MKNEREKLIEYIESKKLADPEAFFDLWKETKMILLHGDLEMFYKSRCYAKWPNLTVEEMDATLRYIKARDHFNTQMKDEFGLG